MSKINKELFNDVSLYNMVWEKKELESIIKAKKDELKENLLNNTVEHMTELIKDGSTSEKEVKEMLMYFMRGITEIEREL